jgi:hypothetical protein
VSNTFHQRFPGYDVLEKWDSPSWNEQTRNVIRDRLENVPERNFFSEQEWNTLHAICQRLIPQSDRGDTPVPIVPFIDRKLHKNEGDGYRFENMPPMRETWRRGIAAVDAESRARHDANFAEIDGNLKDATLRAIQHGDVRSDAWQDLPAKKFFEIMLRQMANIYYAHPAAWNEIGFGGPASPRGYVRLGFDRRDPWEAIEAHD